MRNQYLVMGIVVEIFWILFMRIFFEFSILSCTLWICGATAILFYIDIIFEYPFNKMLSRLSEDFEKSHQLSKS